MFPPLKSILHLNIILHDRTLHDAQQKPRRETHEENTEHQRPRVNTVIQIQTQTMAEEEAGEANSGSIPKHIYTNSSSSGEAGWD